MDTTPVPEPKSRRFTIVGTIAAIVLLAGGIGAYFALRPSLPSVIPIPSINGGLAFEVPVATFLLIAAGATTPDRLAEKRPYIIIGAFVFGMLLTPPDVVSQVMLALPMWALFELGLLASRYLLKERAGEGGENAGTDGGSARRHAPAGFSGREAAVAQALVAESGDYRPMTDEEMEAELEEIDALEEDETNANDADDDPVAPTKGERPGSDRDSTDS